MAVNDIFLCTPQPPNDLKLYDPAIGCAGGTSVDTLTGNLILTGYAPSLAKGIFTSLGQLVLTGYAPSIDISGAAEPDTVTGRIVTMYYAERRRRQKKVKV